MAQQAALREAFFPRRATLRLVTGKTGPQQLDYTYRECRFARASIATKQPEDRTLRGKPSSD